MIRKLLPFAAALALAACETAPQGGSAAQPAGSTLTAEAVSGKTLRLERGDFVVVGEDGTLSGMVGPDQDTALAGTWEVRDGQWCRTLTQPESFRGTECQPATLNPDGTVTIVGRNGPGTFTIE